MKSCLALLMAATLVVAVVPAFLTGSASSLSSHVPTGRIYTVAQVLRGISQDPTEWYGRTVRVRAVAFPQYDGSPRRQGLAMPDVLALDYPGSMPSGGDCCSLFARYGREDALFGLLRRLPFIGARMPQLQRARRNSVAVYEVLLRPPANACDRSGCTRYPQSELIDAAPPMW